MRTIEVGDSVVFEWHANGEKSADRYKDKVMAITKDEEGKEIYRMKNYNDIANGFTEGDLYLVVVDEEGNKRKFKRVNEN